MLPPADPRSIYDPILEQYRQVLSMDSSAFLADPGSHFRGDHAVVRYYHMHHDQTFFFAYRDIDRDGFDELFIGIDGVDWKVIVDMYGTDGTQVFHLLDEPTLGDRSSVILQEDGVFAFTFSDGQGGTGYAWKKLEGHALVDSAQTQSKHISGMPWELLLVEQAPEQDRFNDLLGDIREALTVTQEAYDADSESYDNRYSHLGDGVLWMLTHRQLGNYTVCIWNTYLDLDGDGREELVIGRGVSPSDAEPICVYFADGEAIFGDALYGYLEKFSEAPLQWDYVGG